MLILGLPDAADTADTAEPAVYELVRFGDDARLISHGTFAIAQLPPGPLVAVLPLSRLSWQAVRLPDLPKPQRLPAVIGLLEDQWLQSPASLHISLHPIEGAPADLANYWVCVCDAQWLSQALQALTSAGRMPQRLLPEWSPLDPDQDPVLHVWGTPEQPMLTWCSAQGVLWSAWPNPWPLLQSTPATIVAEPAVLELAAGALAVEPAALRTQTRAERWLAATESGFDLAQGAWSQTRGQRWRRLALAGWHDWVHQPHWRWARRSLAVLLAAQCLGLLSWAWLTEQALAQQQRELAAMLTQAFPQTQLVIDPAAQMHQALQRLRRQVGAPSPEQAEVMLGHLTQALPAPPELQALRFEGQTLSVKGLRLEAIDANQQKHLHSLGYELRSQADGLSMRWIERP